MHRGLLDSATMLDAVSFAMTDAYLGVALARPMSTIDEAHALHREIARRLAAATLTRVLLDYRAVGDHTDEVRECMWAWAAQAPLDPRAPIEAIAAIVTGELTRVRLNMTALARRVPMRAFANEVDAVQWLVKPNTRRTTRIINRV